MNRKRKSILKEKSVGNVELEKTVCRRVSFNMNTETRLFKPSNDDSIRNLIDSMDSDFDESTPLKKTKKLQNGSFEIHKEDETPVENAVSPPIPSKRRSSLIMSGNLDSTRVILNDDKSDEYMIIDDRAMQTEVKTSKNQRKTRSDVSILEFTMISADDNVSEETHSNSLSNDDDDDNKVDLNKAMIEDHDSDKEVNDDVLSLGFVSKELNIEDEFEKSTFLPTVMVSEVKNLQDLFQVESKLNLPNEKAVIKNVAPFTDKSVTKNDNLLKNLGSKEKKNPFPEILFLAKDNVKQSKMQSNVSMMEYSTDTRINLSASVNNFERSEDKRKNMESSQEIDLNKKMMFLDSTTENQPMNQSFEEFNATFSPKNRSTDSNDYSSKKIDLNKSMFDEHEFSYGTDDQSYFNDNSVTKNDNIMYNLSSVKRKNPFPEISLVAPDIVKQSKMQSNVSIMEYSTDTRTNLSASVINFERSEDKRKNIEFSQEIDLNKKMMFLDSTTENQPMNQSFEEFNATCSPKKIDLNKSRFEGNEFSYETDDQSMIHFDVVDSSQEINFNQNTSLSHSLLLDKTMTDKRDAMNENVIFNQSSILNNSNIFDLSLNVSNIESKSTIIENNSSKLFRGDSKCDGNVSRIDVRTPDANNSIALDGDIFETSFENKMIEANEVKDKNLLFRSVEEPTSLLGSNNKSNYSMFSFIDGDDERNLDLTDEIHPIRRDNSKDLSGGALDETLTFVTDNKENSFETIFSSIVEKSREDTHERRIESDAHQSLKTMSKERVLDNSNQTFGYQDMNEMNNESIISIFEKGTNDKGKCITQMFQSVELFPKSKIPEIPNLNKTGTSMQFDEFYQNTDNCRQMLKGNDTLTHDSDNNEGSIGQSLNDDSFAHIHKLNDSIGICKNSASSQDEYNISGTEQKRSTQKRKSCETLFGHEVSFKFSKDIDFEILGDDQEIVNNSVNDSNSCVDLNKNINPEDFEDSVNEMVFESNYRENANSDVSKKLEEPLSISILRPNFNFLESDSKNESTPSQEDNIPATQKKISAHKRKSCETLFGPGVSFKLSKDGDHEVVNNSVNDSKSYVDLNKNINPEDFDDSINEMVFESNNRESTSSNVSRKLEEPIFNLSENETFYESNNVENTNKSINFTADSKKQDESSSKSIFRPSFNLTDNEMFSELNNSENTCKLANFPNVSKKIEERSSKSIFQASFDIEVLDGDFTTDVMPTQKHLVQETPINNPRHNMTEHILSTVKLIEINKFPQKLPQIKVPQVNRHVQSPFHVLQGGSVDIEQYIAQDNSILKNLAPRNRLADVSLTKEPLASLYVKYIVQPRRNLLSTYAQFSRSSTNNLTSEISKIQKKFNTISSKCPVCKKHLACVHQTMLTNVIEELNQNFIKRWDQTVTMFRQENDAIDEIGKIKIQTKMNAIKTSLGTLKKCLQLKTNVKVQGTGPSLEQCLEAVPKIEKLNSLRSQIVKYAQAYLSKDTRKEIYFKYIINRRINPLIVRHRGNNQLEYLLMGSRVVVLIQYSDHTRCIESAQVTASEALFPIQTMIEGHFQRLVNEHLIQLPIGFANELLLQWQMPILLLLDDLNMFRRKESLFVVWDDTKPFVLEARINYLAAPIRLRMFVDLNPIESYQSRDFSYRFDIITNNLDEDKMKEYVDATPHGERKLYRMFMNLMGNFEHVYTGPDFDDD